MEVAFTSLSAAAPRRSTLVSLLPPVLRLILTGGGSIAAAYSRRPSRPEYQFAMHTFNLFQGHITNRNDVRSAGYGTVTSPDGGLTPKFTHRKRPCKAFTVSCGLTLQCPYRFTDCCTSLLEAPASATI